MTDEFDLEKAMKLIRSRDAMTFEAGYWRLSPHASRYVEQLVMAMQAEEDPHMRARFVELLGDTHSAAVIPVLQAELLHPSREVREWAVLGLEELGIPEAQAVALAYKMEHPEEWAS